MATEYLNNKMFEILIQKYQKAQRETHKQELIAEDLDTNGRQFKKTKTYTQAMDKHQKAKEELVLIQHQLTNEFYKLSENIVRYAKFSLIDHDDAIQEGVMICLEKVNRFDPNKGRAFNYMTTCILNHFKQLYRAARNFNELKKRYCEHLNSNVDHYGRPGENKLPNDYLSESP